MMETVNVKIVIFWGTIPCRLLHVPMFQKVLLPPPWGLKTVAAYFSGILVTFYRTTLRYIAVDTVLMYEKLSWDNRIFYRFSRRPNTGNCCKHLRQNL